jgi:hypothetical protein
MLTMQLERPTFCVGKRRNSVCTRKAITANQILQL